MEPAQDANELFDLYDAEGRPLGRTKPRALVHRDGDWHRSLHIWVWGEGCLVLQRRAAGKDTHPRKLDVAVTGHLRAGESIADALREAEEEIGLAVRPEELVRLGLRRRIDRTKPGVIDNELQDIFCLARPVDVTTLRASEAELEAIVTLPLSAAERVLRDGGEASGSRLEGGSLVDEVLRGSDLVPAPDGYYAKAFASVAAVIGGARPAEWVLG